MSTSNMNSSFRERQQREKQLLDLKKKIEEDIDLGLTESNSSRRLSMTVASGMSAAAMTQYRKRQTEIAKKTSATGLGRNAPPWLNIGGVKLGQSLDDIERQHMPERTRKPNFSSSPQVKDSSFTNMKGKEGDSSRHNIVNHRMTGYESLDMDNAPEETNWWVMETETDKRMLRKILSKPPEKRKRSDISFLLRAMTTLPLFQSLNRRVVEKMCHTMCRVTAQKGGIAYRTGQRPQAYFVVISGRVDMVPIDQDDGRGIETMTCGGLFGDTGISLFEERRNVFVVAREPSDFVKVWKADYERIEQSMSTELSDSKSKNMRLMPIFKKMPEEKFKQVLHYISPKQHFSTGQVLQKQSNTAEDIVFIVTGIAKAVKEIPIKQDDGTRSTVLVDVGELGAYDFFGDEGIVMKTPNPFSVYANSPMEVYTLNQHDFLRRICTLDKNLLEMLQSYREAYTPRSNYCRKSLVEASKWDSYKDQMKQEAFDNKTGRNPMLGDCIADRIRSRRPELATHTIRQHKDKNKMRNVFAPVRASWRVKDPMKSARDHLERRNSQLHDSVAKQHLGGSSRSNAPPPLTARF